MKKIFEIPEITKLSLVTERVTDGLPLDGNWGGGVEAGSMGEGIPEE